MQNIVLFGPPNSGKGTLADKLEDCLFMKQLGTGNMLRKLANEGNPIGVEARDKYWGNNGKYVPDDMIVELVNQMLKKPEYIGGAIFDGFPRTIPQAEEFDKLGLNYDVLFLDAPDEVLIRRAQTRRVCSECDDIYNIETKPPKNPGFCDSCHYDLIQRDDDLNIHERLEVYKELTAPLEEYYKGGLKKVDSSISAEETLKQTLKFLIPNP